MARGWRRSRDLGREEGNGPDVSGAVSPREAGGRWLRRIKDSIWVNTPLLLWDKDGSL